jgi:predicted DNA-binding transcriptional regulator YafY
VVDRLERLVNLVIALRETRRPLTVEQVNTRVAGYGGRRDDAWRRMFERDKADLRDLGVPLRTERLDRHDDAVGYRIDAADYDLPSVSLTPAELTALALAVQVTGLGDDAAPALDKLAVGAGAPAQHRRVPDVPLRLGLDTPGRPVDGVRTALAEALLARRPVRFAYRRPQDAAGEAARRRVEPHALLHHRGRWYLRGHDVDRGADRTFRLDRIEGAVRPVGEPGTVVLPDQPPDPRAVVPGADTDPVDAVVLADPDRALAVARRARGAGEPVAGREGWRRFVLRAVDPDELVGWLLDQGDGVELVEPDVLRARIVVHLRSVAGT